MTQPLEEAFGTRLENGHKKTLEIFNSLPINVMLNIRFPWKPGESSKKKEITS